MVREHAVYDLNPLKSTGTVLWPRVCAPLLAEGVFYKRQSEQVNWLCGSHLLQAHRCSTHHLLPCVTHTFLPKFLREKKCGLYLGSTEILPRPLPTMLSDKVRTWKEGIHGVHLSGGERGTQRGAAVFLGLLLVTSLLILFTVLLWTLIPMRRKRLEPWGNFWRDN